MYKKKKILLVARERINELDISSTLNELGYKVNSIVDNDKDVVKKCSIEKPNLVLIDIDLDKGRSSINIAKTILKKFKIPVVFLNVSQHEMLHNSKWLKQPVSFLTRPNDPLELQAAIEMAFLDKAFFMTN